ncbi:MAG: hypothetical protein A2280_01380 [Candidatus Staskawiczbacteria bacterium RIFOXYA12_FULL_37_10]|nr:MAG: hypothetical protein A2280_01380 [Candidatus Staskawiczbacteria bacterium RIFOXYA12_FULL_37_10]
MESFSPDIKKLFSLIHKNEKIVAMLAPSFPVVFEYPQIVGMLKRMGFKYVAEVARGAEETNKQLLALTKLHPDRRYITNPCPTVVRIIRNKYPELFQYLSPIDSPMSATAKICNKKYPGCKKVFIGPCIMKKLEASEDRPELDILVLTYKELKIVFDIEKIRPEKRDMLAVFDIKAVPTRLYPVSGGLSQSAGIIEKFTDPEYDVVSGPELVEKTLKEFANKTELKLLDILNCNGACIAGPGIASTDSIDRRRQKIINYWNKR